MNRNMTMAQSEITRQSGPRHRISSDNFADALDLLRSAAAFVVPDDQKQRQAFEKLMPELYVLRNKGCSFEQLTKLLSKVGFKLQPSTVRTYYSELLATRLDLCQARMNEQIAIMAALREENAGVDMSRIAGRVAATMAAQREASARRVDALLGLGGGSVSPPPALPPAVPSPATAQVAPRPSARPAPAPALEPGGDDEAGEFGLLNVKPAVARSNNEPAGFFSMEDGTQAGTPSPKLPSAPSPKPAPPRHAPSSPPAAAASTPTAAAATKTLLPLKAGVAPLKPRAGDNVAAEVYAEGTLEHPAIPGLMLTLEQRLYGASLEYIDADGGEILTETPDEKRMRVKWRKPVAVTVTRTGASFTQMDKTLFPG